MKIDKNVGSYKPQLSLAYNFDALGAGFLCPGVVQPLSLQFWDDFVGGSSPADTQIFLAGFCLLTLPPPAHNQVQY